MQLSKEKINAEAKEQPQIQSKSKAGEMPKPSMKGSKQRAGASKGASGLDQSGTPPDEQMAPPTLAPWPQPPEQPASEQDTSKLEVKLMSKAQTQVASRPLKKREEKQLAKAQKKEESQPDKEAAQQMALIRQ